MTPMSSKKSRFSKPHTVLSPASISYQKKIYLPEGYAHERKEDNNGTTVYWWTAFLETTGQYKFDPNTTEAVVTGGTGIHAVLEVLSETTANVHISTMEIRFNENGGFSNTQIPSIFMQGSKATAVTEPTEQESYRGNQYYLTYDNSSGSTFTFISDASGKRLTGWVVYNNGSGEKWYYFTPAEMNITINSQTIRLPAGAMVYSTWLKDGNYYYYLKDDGSMATNEWINHKYLNDKGIYCTW